MAQHHFDHNNHGFATLVSVIIAGAIGGAIAVGLLLGGTDAVDLAEAAQEAHQARALADACTEQALQTLHDDLSFTGSVQLTLSTGTCTAEVLNLGGAQREVRSSGVAVNTTRRVRIIIDALQPTISVSSSEDIASF